MRPTVILTGVFGLKHCQLEYRLCEDALSGLQVRCWYDYGLEGSHNTDWDDAHVNGANREMFEHIRSMLNTPGIFS